MGFVFIPFAIEDNDLVRSPIQAQCHLYFDDSYRPKEQGAEGRESGLVLFVASDAAARNATSVPVTVPRECAD